MPRSILMLTDPMTAADRAAAKQEREAWATLEKRNAELEADLRQAITALVKIRDEAVSMPNGGAWSAGLATLCVGTMKTFKG